MIMKSLSKTGFVNMTEALRQHPEADKVSAAIIKTRESIRQEYSRAAKELPEDEKRTLSATLGQKAAQIEKELARPLMADINKAMDKIFHGDGSRSSSTAAR
jgi:Skp family chaperone for outer membrane proteins